MQDGQAVEQAKDNQQQHQQQPNQAQVKRRNQAVWSMKESHWERRITSFRDV